MNYSCAQFTPQKQIFYILTESADDEGVGEEYKKIIESLNNTLEHYFTPVYSRWLEIPEIKFEILKDEWETETIFLSSDTDISTHPAYQQIIGMGIKAVPMILKELQKGPNNWFWALKAITGEDPVPPNDMGRMEKMTDAWLRWGEENDYI